MSTAVHSVDSVDIELEKKNPPNVIVKAKGQVTSSGWTNPQLAARVYVQPPADGVQELDFIATEPTGMSTPAMVDVYAELNMGEAEPWIRGYRVIAETNSKETVYA